MSSGFSLDLNSAMRFSDEGVFSRVLAKADSYHFTMMCLAKGTDIDTHTSTKNGGIIVLKGKGTFILEGQTIDMVPGVFIFMPANAKHSLSAAEDLAFLLCLCK